MEVDAKVAHRAADAAVHRFPMPALATLEQVEATQKVPDCLC